MCVDLITMAASDSGNWINGRSRGRPPAPGKEGITGESTALQAWSSQRGWGIDGLLMPSWESPWCIRTASRLAQLQQMTGWLLTTQAYVAESLVGRNLKFWMRQCSPYRKRMQPTACSSSLKITQSRTWKKIKNNSITSLPQVHNRSKIIRGSI